MIDVYNDVFERYNVDKEEACRYFSSHTRGIELGVDFVVLCKADTDVEWKLLITSLSHCVCSNFVEYINRIDLVGKQLIATASGEHVCLEDARKYFEEMTELKERLSYGLVELSLFIS